MQTIPFESKIIFFMERRNLRSNGEVIDLRQRLNLGDQPGLA
jgi:hypothetical protein